MLTPIQVKINIGSYVTIPTATGMRTRENSASYNTKETTVKKESLHWRIKEHRKESRLGRVFKDIIRRGALQEYVSIHTAEMTPIKKSDERPSRTTEKII